MPGQGQERPSKSMGGLSVYGDAGRVALVGGVSGGCVTSSRWSRGASCSKVSVWGSVSVSFLLSSTAGAQELSIPVQLLPASLLSTYDRPRESSPASIEILRL